MVRPHNEMNYFAVMGLTPSATETEIRKAYRKLSLALHPDKNRNVDPELASARFHEMQLAYEVLMDPSARLAAAERNKAQAAKAERRGAYEGKRKEMTEELERREEEDRLKRFKGAQDEQKRKQTLEVLREEGRKLREEKERKLSAIEEQARDAQQKDNKNGVHVPHAASSDEPSLGPLDLTVRLRFPADQFSDLTQSSASTSATTDTSLTTPLARALEARFGKLDSLMWKAPKTGKKEATGHATFVTLDAAYSAVHAGHQLRAGGPGLASVLEDVWIGWAAGKGASEPTEDGKVRGEPERISWLRKQGKLPDNTQHSRATEEGQAKKVPPRSEDDILSKMRSSGSNSGMRSSDRESSSFPAFSFSTPTTPAYTSSTQASFDDLETSILKKMRQAERDKIDHVVGES